MKFLPLQFFHHINSIFQYAWVHFLICLCLTILAYSPHLIILFVTCVVFISIEKSHHFLSYVESELEVFFFRLSFSSHPFLMQFQCVRIYSSILDNMKGLEYFWTIFLCNDSSLSCLPSHNHLAYNSSKNIFVTHMFSFYITPFLLLLLMQVFLEGNGLHF